MIIKSILLATMLAFSTLTVSAQTAAVPQSPEVGATCDQGKSLQSFKDAVTKTNTDIIVVEGDQLQRFAGAIDKLLNAEHDPAITALAFLNPEGVKEDKLQVMIFKNGCFTGMVPLPTQVIRQAYGEAV